MALALTRTFLASSESKQCAAVFTAAVVDKVDKRIAIEQVALTRAAKLDQVETVFVRALEEIGIECIGAV